MITFAPATKAKSAEVNQNFTDIASGAGDATNNSLDTYRKQNMANYVQAGVALPTSASLTATLAGGVAYVNGKYLIVPSQSVTLVASKDTYLDIKDDGTLAQVAVTNGATTGMTLTTNADGSDALRIGKHITSGSAITSSVTTGLDPLLNFIANKNPFGVTKVLRPTFTNSWVDFDTTSFGPVYYYKDKTGMVSVTGLMKSGTLATSAFTLPAGMRPTNKLLFTTTNNGALGRVDVNTDGTVVMAAGSTADCSLNTIKFIAAA